MATMDEEQLRAVTLGEPTQVNGTIELEEYDDAWPALYAAEAEKITSALGPKMLQLEHVGSTSVPGLAAKPIIDILLVVASSADENAYVPQLEQAGYTLRIREPEWYEHRLLKGSGINLNLHVFSDGCPEINRMLLFRNRLRKVESERRLYEEEKRKLAAQHWKFVQEYADAKTAIVEQIIQRASTPYSPPHSYGNSWESQPGYESRGPNAPNEPWGKDPWTDA